MRFGPSCALPLSSNTCITCCTFAHCGPRSPPCRAPDQPHIPTLINDLLYEYCVAVAVSANAGDGSCFRGMECAQFETMGKVYDIAILLAPNLKRAAGEAEP
eukprot:GHVT01096056.1.p1 GENE.GHVT01096056.1~~GHVT01096056.1.p1  ORF type:complete len:102 (+),score=6.52 GHVT01096056.1:171-476(+)